MTTLARIADSLFAPFTRLVCAALLIAGCTQDQGSFEAVGSSETSNEIIGGVVLSKSHAVTSTTALLYNDDLKESICTVTLISNQYAVTAAHCIEIAREQSFRLVFGPKYQAANPSRRVLAARALRSRTGREGEVKNAFDIALIKYAGGLPQGYKAATLLPNMYAHFLKAGIPSAIAGFGINNLDAGPIDTLRLTSVFIHNGAFSSTEVQMDQTKGHGACKGDSGGPAYLLIGGMFYFWGVASRGVNRQGELVDDCAQYVIYTNALLFLPGLKSLFEY